jgi:hypothetical protein
VGERRGAYNVLLGKPKGRRPLERLRRIWEDNIKLDLRKMELGSWNGSSWLRIATSGGLL